LPKAHVRKLEFVFDARESGIGLWGFILSVQVGYVAQGPNSEAVISTAFKCV